MNKTSFVSILRPVSIKGKIRLGRNSDGGYIVYSGSLQSTDALITYGVGWEYSFEEHFNKITDKPVFMFDPDMFGKYIMNFKYFRKLLFRLRLGGAIGYLYMVWAMWRKKIALQKKNIFFVNEGWGNSGEKKYDSLANHIRRFKLDKKTLLLKIDIEGAEYDLFEDPLIGKQLQHVNQMAVEFHDLKNRLHRLRNILARLEKDFYLIHIHANNCAPTFVLYDLDAEGEDIVVPDTVELSFVRRDKVRKEDLIERRERFPVKELDFPNDPRKEDYVLNFI